MSFPERLTLGHLIDGENDKDAVMTKEHRADQTHHRNVDVLSSDITATVNNDTGEHVLISAYCHEIFRCIIYQWSTTLAQPTRTRPAGHYKTHAMKKYNSQAVRV